MRKLTIEQIREVFAKRGCVLLSNEYQNAHVKLDYQCSRGHPGQITWNSFQQGTLCSECAGNRRHKFDSIREFFEKEGYVLLSTHYTNTQDNLCYVCPDGHEGTTYWNLFQQGHRCAQCAGFIDPVIKLAKIRTYFEKEGYKLLSTKYKNPSTKLDFICSQGHNGSMSWTGFNRGSRCAKCMGRAIPSIEEVRQYFEQYGCKLLSTEYVNAHEKLDYICSKSHRVSIAWTNFYNLGHRCAKCCEPKKQKRLGELLEQLFPGKVGKQDHFNFLGLLSVDYSVRDLGLAFEYDGEHHFMPTQYGNMSLNMAKERFVAQQERDACKNRLCKENNYKMIRIAYYEDLTLENVQKKIDVTLQVEVSNG
jgi:uncharacterized protein YkuJ